MRAVFLFSVLGVFALNSAAQTASASLQNAAGSSTLGNGTAQLEDRVGECRCSATLHSSFSTHPAPRCRSSPSIWRLAEDSELPFSTSQKLHYDLFVDGDTAPDSSTDLPHAEDGRATPTLALQPVEPPHHDTKIHWKAANGEALLSTGIYHTFNIWTEAGTRDALYGPWAKDWLRSVGELRGWSDSDEFMAPYVGHPIQGSIFGYILRQNDPKYRDVQWGDGRDYFMSLLRSMGYSAVWHTQWKIGPISEASIGNVMLHASPGFITLVDTPTLGAITMIGEDALDRYLIMGLENRTANRPLIALTRCFLNPGRSFANLMAFRVPWHRDTRIGIVGQNFIVRKELLADYRAGIGPKPFEFVRRPNDSSDAEPEPRVSEGRGHRVGGVSQFRAIFPMAGIALEAEARVPRAFSRRWQIVAEVNGCLIMGFSHYTQSGDSLFYGAGPRWTPLASASLFTVRRGAVRRTKSDLRSGQPGAGEQAAERMERWQRHTAALSQAQRLVHRSFEQWCQPCRRRRPRCRGHPALHLASSQCGVHPFVDGRCGKHSSREWISHHHRSGPAHRNVVIRFRRQSTHLGSMR